jgi:hypothetical protein
VQRIRGAHRRGSSIATPQVIIYTAGRGCYKPGGETKKH